MRELAAQTLWAISHQLQLRTSYGERPSGLATGRASLRSMIRLGANASAASDRSLRTLRRIGGALAYCGKQRLGLADQLPATRLIEHLIAEGRSIEHGPHLPGDPVALRRPPKELVGQRDIYRVVRGIAALERERGDGQRV